MLSNMAKFVETIVQSCLGFTSFQPFFSSLCSIYDMIDHISVVWCTLHCSIIPGPNAPLQLYHEFHFSGNAEITMSNQRLSYSFQENAKISIIVNVL